MDKCGTVRFFAEVSENRSVCAFVSMNSHTLSPPPVPKDPATTYHLEDCQENVPSGSQTDAIVFRAKEAIATRDVSVPQNQPDDGLP
jgi:hypothetical protein